MPDQLGIPFYDYNIIRLAKSSLDKKLFANYEQNKIGTIRHDLAKEVNIDYSLDDKVFDTQSEVIRKVAEKGPCVIVGRCADYILKDKKDVLNVFIYADKDSRRKRIEKVYIFYLFFRRYKKVRKYFKNNNQIDN